VDDSPNNLTMQRKTKLKTSLI